MVPGVRTSLRGGRSPIGRAAIVLALLATLSGCGSTLKGSPADAMSCPGTVLGALGHVVARVYHEGVSSERTATARNFIAHSAALRAAVEGGNAVAARTVAQGLVAGGHMTNLRVMRGARTLADVGGPALAPLRGVILGAGGARIGSYVTSVWSDEGFLAESDGIGEGAVALRAHGRSIAGSFALPSRALPATGTVESGHMLYQYTSFPAKAYPSGSLRVYLLKSVRSTGAFCGRTSEDTLVNTLGHVARLIYAGEAGRRTLPQVQRVQSDQALLGAVARRDPAATRLAVEGLLNQHIVRLRVSAGGRLLADVGGPYVLAPVRGTLRLGGRTIGSFVLSIQDDEGYLRLTRRLAGLYVLMYMNPTHPTLVKNSLGPAPGSVPDSGSYSYRGRSFRVLTLHVSAFPSGPLAIKVLIPIPYS
jgi:hypothetical protein